MSIDAEERAKRALAPKRDIFLASLYFFSDGFPYLVENIIPLLYAIASPRVDSAWLNPPTVSR